MYATRISLSLVAATTATVTLLGQLLAAPAAEQDSPPLSLHFTDKFVRQYDDSGTGAKDDVSIWRPKSIPGYYSLGDVAVSSHSAPQNAVLVKGDGDALAAPVDFREVWNDHGSGGDRDGALWEPICPSGYVALGYVGNPGYDKPTPNVMRCVKRELTVQGAASKVWDDTKSGARKDVGVWRVDAPTVAVRGEGGQTLRLPAPTAFSLSTFIARPSHNLPSSDLSRFRVLDRRFIADPAFAGNTIGEDTARTFAPHLYLHPDEKFNPSSVEFFLAHVHEDNGFYVTNESLGGNDSADPAFFKGQRPGVDAIPAYAEIVQRTSDGAPTGVVDIIYFFFYPYNEGKDVCIGIDGPLGCAGKKQSFGNHVGDWEHITVRFLDNQPVQVFYSQHGGGKLATYGSQAVSMEGTHPVVYPAKGSHASYATVGSHKYQSLYNGGDGLVDVAGRGALWDTEQHLVVFPWQPAGSYTGPLSWLNFRGRWGNPERGCLPKPIGQCVLENGPEGPITKPYFQPPLKAMD